MNLYNVVGVEKINGKDGRKWIKLHLVSKDIENSDTFVGCSVSIPFIGVDECELVGCDGNWFNLVGNCVRVFKETINNRDKVTLVQVFKPDTKK